MKINNYKLGSAAEAIIYPLLFEMLLIVIWLAEMFANPKLMNLGVKPGDWSHWYGIFFMPLLHDPHHYEHILNNSLPFLLLTAALFFYYRNIAWIVLLISWVGSGLIVWLFAEPGGVHIGMSGVIYALFGFLFLSGFFKNVLYLQVLTLGVSFLYGSMIWGIFPMDESISWEGHFGGMLFGVTLAVFFRKHGPERRKYQYEIEQEMGIEPPDFEGEYNARVEQLRLMQEELEQKQREALHFVYHITPSRPLEESEEKHEDGEGKP